MLEDYMLHVLDVRANYWSLWTESANLAHYNERYPRGFERLRANLGYPRASRKARTARALLWAFRYSR